jgi:ABC-2 type transport system permease protein
MTSRSLLCRLMREDVKRRLWAIAISMIAFLFVLPVYIATSLERELKLIKVGMDIGDKKFFLSNTAMQCLGLNNIPLELLTIILAVICGISGFYYLQSKKKVDFYHSLPVKRESLFASSYVVGIAIYVIPYLLSLAIGFVIVGANGVFQTDVLLVAWRAFGVNLLNYCITYTVVIIAVLLTGQLIVSILATGVFFAYGPIVTILIYSLSDMYFDTYYEYSVTNSIIFNCSPISAYYNMIRAVTDGTLQVSKVFIYLIAFIALVIIAVFLYHKRMSEAAGKAISYKVLQPYIKTAVSVAIGLLSGLMFASIMNTNSTFWLIFGMVCGYLLCSCIMEIIYHFDFRAAFKSRLQLLIGAVIMFAVFSTYKWDLLNYDQYVPSKDKVASMSISCPSIDVDQSFRVIDEDKGQTKHMDRDEYAFDYMYLEDKDLAYEIAKRAAKEDGTIREEDLNETNKYMQIIVLYRLKSGRKVYRTYNIEVEPYFDSLNQLYQTKEYKEGAFPIYKLKNVTSVSCYNEFQSLDITLTKEERAQLLALYLDELTKLSLEDVRAEAPLATINFGYYTDNISTYYSASVYPSFTKTIAFLSEHGFDFDKTFNLDNIVELNIDYSIPYENREDERYLSYAKENQDWNYVMNITYNDKDQISKIIPYLVNRDYAWNNSVLTNYDYNLNISVITKTDEFGNRENYQYAIDINNIPDFVKEDIMYAEP